MFSGHNRNRFPVKNHVPWRQNSEFYFQHFNIKSVPFVGACSCFCLDGVLPGPFLFFCLFLPSTQVFFLSFLPRHLFISFLFWNLTPYLIKRRRVDDKWRVIIYLFIYLFPSRPRHLALSIVVIHYLHTLHFRCPLSILSHLSDF